MSSAAYPYDGGHDEAEAVDSETHAPVGRSRDADAGGRDAANHGRSDEGGRPDRLLAERLAERDEPLAASPVASAATFRKRPVEVEAVRFDGANWRECCRFIGAPTFDEDETLGDPEELYVETLHGMTTTQVGDWIIKGPSGDFWPCKPDIFEETYEPAE